MSDEEDSKHVRPTDLRAPFSTTRLEEDKPDEKGSVFTVRTNEADDDALGELMQTWGLERNAAVRAAIHLARNVTQAQYAGGLADLLFKKKRMRA